VGRRSFNIGAGMARTYTAAAFVKRNMPIGFHEKFPLGQGGLSDQDAVDVAEYFTHQDRPDFPDKVKDWPKDPKPRDALLSAARRQACAWPARVPRLYLPTPGLALTLALRLCPVLILAAEPAVAAQADVRIAVLAFQGSERAAQDFEPTLAHLAAAGRHHWRCCPGPGRHRAGGAAHGGLRRHQPRRLRGAGGRPGVTRLATLESRDHAVPTDTVGSTVITPNRAGHPRALPIWPGAAWPWLARCLRRLAGGLARDGGRRRAARRCRPW
jgi:hypothetical protein